MLTYFNEALTIESSKWWSKAFIQKLYQVLSIWYGSENIFGHFIKS